MADIKTLNDAFKITARKTCFFAREGVYGNFFTDIIEQELVNLLLLVDY